VHVTVQSNIKPVQEVVDIFNKRSCYHFLNKEKNNQTLTSCVGK